MRLAGIEVSPDDAEWLVGRLYQDAHAPAVSVAHRIQKALELDTRILALSHEERMTILGLLDDPPLSLSDFRGRLMKDASSSGKGRPSSTPG